MTVDEATSIATSPQPRFKDCRFHPAVEVTIYMQLIKRLIDCHEVQACRKQIYWTKHLHTKPQSWPHPQRNHVLQYNAKTACQAMECYLVTKLRHSHTSTSISCSTRLLVYRNYPHFEHHRQYGCLRGPSSSESASHLNSSPNRKGKQSPRMVQTTVRTNCRRHQNPKKHPGSMKINRLQVLYDDKNGSVSTHNDEWRDEDTDYEISSLGKVEYYSRVFTTSSRQCKVYQKIHTSQSWLSYSSV